MTKKIVCNAEDLTAIADAVRASNGSTNTYNVPELSAAAVNAIGTGGAGVSVDDTLTISGAAADAKVTGDRIAMLGEEIENKQPIGDYLTKVEDGSITIAKLADEIIDGEKVSNVTTLIIENPYEKETSVKIIPSIAGQIITHMGENLADFSEGQFKGSKVIEYNPKAGSITAKVSSYNSTHVFIDKLIPVESNVLYHYSALYSAGSMVVILIQPYDSNGNALTSGLSSGDYIASWGGTYYKTSPFNTKFDSNVAYVKLGIVFHTNVDGINYLDSIQTISSILFCKDQSNSNFTEAKYITFAPKEQVISLLAKGNNYITSDFPFDAQWNFIGSAETTNAPVNVNMLGADAIFRNALGEEIFRIDGINEFVSVKRYGAVGDGIVDDTEAIQTAINDNKKIYLPAGKYKITSPIVVKTGRIIQGETDQSTIIQALGCDCFHLPAYCESTLIKCLALKGDGSTSGYDAIRFTGTNIYKMYFDNLYISNFQRGISSDFVGSNNNIYFSNLFIKTCEYGIFMPTASHAQINNIIIRDCEIGQCNTGILISGQAHSILCCCIQACDFGIVMDGSIAYGKFDNETTGSSNGITIVGVYMEQIIKSCIFGKVYFNNPYVGFISGLTIVGCYFNREFPNVDLSYADIQLKTDNINSIYSFYNPKTNGREVSNLTIVGNVHYSSNFDITQVDLGNLTGSDCIIQCGRIGTMSPVKNALTAVNSAGAKVIGQDNIVKKIFPLFKGFYDESTIVTANNATIPKGCSILIDTETNQIDQVHISGNCTTYPCDIKVTFIGINKTDGCEEEMKVWERSYNEAFSDSFVPSYTKDNPFYKYSTIMIRITSASDGLVVNNLIMDVVK